MVVLRYLIGASPRKTGIYLRSRFPCLYRYKGFYIIMFGLVVTGLMFLHFYLLPIASGAYNNECYLSKENYHNLQYAVQTIGQVMKKHNVTYWLDYGTLVGAMRHGNVLLWDGDADISFLYEDDKVPMHEELIKLGFHSNGLIAQFQGDTIDYVRWTKEKAIFNGKEEILLHKFYPTSVLQNENVVVKYHHKLESFPLSWAIPTRTVDFHGIKLSIPNSPHKLLRHRYPFTYSHGISVPYKWKCYIPCWIRKAEGC